LEGEGVVDCGCAGLDTCEEEDAEKKEGEELVADLESAERITTDKEELCNEARHGFEEVPETQEGDGSVEGEEEEGKVEDFEADPVEGGGVREGGQHKGPSEKETCIALCGEACGAPKEGEEEEEGAEAARGEGEPCVDETYEAQEEAVEGRCVGI
jgi:hypothetical protein